MKKQPTKRYRIHIIWHVNKTKAMPEATFMAGFLLEHEAREYLAKWQAQAFEGETYELHESDN